MALTDADMQRMSNLLDQKLAPINDKLDRLTEGVRLLLYANPQLWPYSPFEEHPGTFTLPQRRATG